MEKQKHHTEAAAAHPEYPQEQENLSDTLALLEEQIEFRSRPEPSAGNPHSDLSLQELYHTTLPQLRAARERVYVGRIDFLPEDTKTIETYYFGEVPIWDEKAVLRVVSAYSEAYSLFIKNPIGRLAYTVNATAERPESVRHGRILLKRSFDLHRAEILYIGDEVDERPGRTGKNRLLVDGDEILRHYLETRKGRSLESIIGTIREQQYNVMQAAPDQVLIVQGVAGSGKTSIALHRLAYLLYPGNHFQIRANKCIVFGPNLFFLAYISKLVPGVLGESVAQSTLSDWALRQIGLPTSILTDPTFDLMLDHQVDPHLLSEKIRASRIKTSLRMGEVIQRFVEYRRQIQIPPQGLSFDSIGPMQVGLQVTADEIRVAHTATNEPVLLEHQLGLQRALEALLRQQYPAKVRRKAEEEEEKLKAMEAELHLLETEINQLDEQAEKIVAEVDADPSRLELLNPIEDQLGPLRTQSEKKKRELNTQRLTFTRRGEQASNARVTQQVFNDLRPRLAKDLEGFWPAVNPIVDLGELWHEPPLLQKMGAGLLTEEELAALELYERPRQGSIDESDLPAIHYLHLLVKGGEKGVYDHIVVDEAQEIAPLHFAVLQHYARNGSLTVLGDLSQSIYSHRGIDSWERIKEAFPKFKHDYSELTTGFRATANIMRFANMVAINLRKARKLQISMFPAEPFARPGEEPVLHKLRSSEEIPIAVLNTIQVLQKNKWENIGIITKTPERARNLAANFRASNFRTFTLADSGATKYDGGVVLVPVALAKGLEFQAGIVIDVDFQTYGVNELDGRLLYVALTRAIHVLHVLWVGSESALLRGSVTKARPKRTRRAHPTRRKRA